jgi:hypothetical protein
MDLNNFNFSSRRYMTDPCHVEPERYGLTDRNLMALGYYRHWWKEVFVLKKTRMSSFDGRHRSGKSLSSVVSGYLLDKTFYKRMQYRIVQDHHEFMDELEHVKKEGIKGAYLQVDEAGVSMSSDDWYESWMKTLSKTMQMFGYLHPQISFTTPVQDFVSSKLRKMLHAYHSVSRPSNDYSTIKPYRLVYSTLRKKMMTPHPVIRLFDTRIKLTSFQMPKPPPKLIDAYESIANPSKDKMLDAFISDSKSARAEKSQEEVDVEGAAQQVYDNIDIYSFKVGRRNKVVFDEAMIETKFQVRPKIAKLIKRLAERKYKESRSIEEEDEDEEKAPTPQKIIPTKSEWL